MDDYQYQDQFDYPHQEGQQRGDGDEFPLSQNSKHVSSDDDSDPSSSDSEEEEGRESENEDENDDPLPDATQPTMASNNTAAAGVFTVPKRRLPPKPKPHFQGVCRGRFQFHEYSSPDCMKKPANKKKDHHEKCRAITKSDCEERDRLMVSFNDICSNKEKEHIEYTEKLEDEIRKLHSSIGELCKEGKAIISDKKKILKQCDEKDAKLKKTLANKDEQHSRKLKAKQTTHDNALAKKNASLKKAKDDAKKAKDELKTTKGALKKLEAENEKLKKQIANLNNVNTASGGDNANTSSRGNYANRNGGGSSGNSNNEGFGGGTNGNSNNGGFGGGNNGTNGIRKIEEYALKKQIDFEHKRKLAELEGDKKEMAENKKMELKKQKGKVIQNAFRSMTSMTDAGAVTNGQFTAQGIMKAMIDRLNDNAPQPQFHPQNNTMPQPTPPIAQQYYAHAPQPPAPWNNNHGGHHFAPVATNQTYNAYPSAPPANQHHQGYATTPAAPPATNQNYNGHAPTNQTYNSHSAPPATNHQHGAYATPNTTTYYNNDNGYNNVNNQAGAPQIPALNTPNPGHGNNHYEPPHHNAYQPTQGHLGNVLDNGATHPTQTQYFGDAGTVGGGNQTNGFVSSAPGQDQHYGNAGIVDFGVAASGSNATLGGHSGYNATTTSQTLNRDITAPTNGPYFGNTGGGFAQSSVGGSGMPPPNYQFPSSSRDSPHDTRRRPLKKRYQPE